jgi:hypothetical protein
MLKHLSLVTTFSLLALVSCRKEDKTDPTDFDYTSASDNARAEDYFADMLNAVDDAADANGLRDANDACAPTVTFDTLVMPHTLTIDFGTVNCTTTSGRMRRGMLNVTFTGRHHAPGLLCERQPRGRHEDRDEHGPQWRWRPVLHRGR